MMKNPGGGGALFSVPGLRDLTEIGHGASGTVYRAHDAELNRWVAVKVLSSDDPADPARKRFQREREITANLGKHPHIVQVLGTGFTSNGLPYVAMELYEQGSVADHLRREGTFSVPEVVELGVKIADALDAAHRAGVLHRDIKPQNILLSEYGPALADFGIARAQANLEWSQSLDQLTPMHAAPEILLGEAPTPQADVYSLGSTLYTMLAGRPPFAGPAGESPLRYQVRVAQNPVPPLARADVPPELTALITKALAKRPEDRYPTATAMREGLAKVGRLPLDVQDPATVDFPVGPVARPDVGLSADEANLEEPTRSRVSLRSGDDLAAAGQGIPAPTDLANHTPPPTTMGFDPIASLDDAPTTLRSGPRPTHVDSERDDDAAARRRRLLVGSAIAASVVVIALAAALFLRLGSATTGKGGTAGTSQGAFALADAPSNLQLTASSTDTSVFLQWTDNTGGTAPYSIWQIGPNGLKVLPVLSKGTTRYSASSLVPQQPYCFVVNAYLTSGRIAPTCGCINGGKLSGTPAGFPALTCTT
jgi:serine/threonine protein kinase